MSIYSVKKNKIREKNTIEKEYMQLIENLKSTQLEISNLDATVDFVTEPILLNQIIFQRKAAEMRYRYWYKLAREMKEAHR